jgi:hypothetical protein
LNAQVQLVESLEKEKECIENVEFYMTPPDSPPRGKMLISGVRRLGQVSFG